MTNEVILLQLNAVVNILTPFLGIHWRMLKVPRLFLGPTLSRYYNAIVSTIPQNPRFAKFSNVLKALFWVYYIIPMNVDPRINRGCFKYPPIH